MRRAMVAEVPAPGKRERILRAAIDVFAESGYFNAKVTDIAKAAGVADGTIYLYFDGKDELLITIFREHTRNYLQSLERDLAPVLRPEARSDEPDYESDGSGGEMLTPEEIADLAELQSRERQWRWYR